MCDCNSACLNGSGFQLPFKGERALKQSLHIQEIMSWHLLFPRFGKRQLHLLEKNYSIQSGKPSQKRRLEEGLKKWGTLIHQFKWEFPKYVESAKEGKVIFVILLMRNWLVYGLLVGCIRRLPFGPQHSWRLDQFLLF